MIQTKCSVYVLFPLKEKNKMKFHPPISAGGKRGRRRAGGGAHRPCRWSLGRLLSVPEFLLTKTPVRLSFDACHSAFIRRQDRSRRRRAAVDEQPGECPRLRERFLPVSDPGLRASPQGAPLLQALACSHDLIRRSQYKN